MMQADALGECPRADAVARGGTQQVLIVLLLTLVIIGIGAGYGWLQYGSLHSAMGAVKGDPLLVDQPLKAMDGIRPGDRVTVRYTLTNVSSGPITLLGMGSSCSCTVMDGLPLTLAPATSRTLTAAIETHEDETGLDGSIQIFTDHPLAAELALGYRIRFLTQTGDVGSHAKSD